MSDYKYSTECRSCGNKYIRDFLDLGEQPLVNSLIKAEDLNKPEDKYPLTLAVCGLCTLVQIRETVDPSILFKDYVYFSSQSKTMVESARVCVERVISDEKLNRGSLAVELASNDGYLLQHYMKGGIPVLGIDPAENIAKIANGAGIKTLPEFFTTELADKMVKDGMLADVVHANNVLAHVADTNGFVAGIKKILKPSGLVVVEVPYIGDFIDKAEFDTTYHEHLCYFSFTSIDKLFTRNGLKITKIERLPIHGGSLRVFARKSSYWVDGSVDEIFKEEKAKGLELGHYYFGGFNTGPSFEQRVFDKMTKFWTKVRELAATGEVAAYGAAAKGNTLLNFDSLDRDPTLIKFIADSTPAKQGKFAPGTHIPIITPEEFRKRNPKHCIILPWNFAAEISKKENEYVIDGGTFWVPDEKLGLKEWK
jgi:SAM-dependent methyltransferase